MNGSEKSLWDWLLRDWKKVARTVLQCTRVENSTASGMPDVEGCYTQVQFWIELKVADRPANSTTNIDVKHLRPKQAEWLHNRWLAGGNAWILIRIVSSLYLIPGKYARQVKAGMTEAELNKISVCHPDASQQRILNLVTTQ